MTTVGVKVVGVLGAVAQKRAPQAAIGIVTPANGSAEDALEPVAQALDRQGSAAVVIRVDTVGEPQ